MAKRFLCPRCFEDQNVSDIGFLCSNDSCEKAKNKEIQKNINVSGQRCSGESCNHVLIMKACPLCKNELPLNIGEFKNYSLAVIGAKETGKSNYIAVLINQLKNEIGRSFNCSLQDCGESTISRYREEFYNPLYRHRTVVRGTDSGNVDPLIYTLMFERKRLFRSPKKEAVSLTFFDTAGENLDKIGTMQTYNRYLYKSSGIILLLDPLQLPKVREALTGKIERMPEENTDVNSILTRTIDIIRTGQNNMDPSKKIDIPIAIAFTKIDAVASLIDPASSLNNESTHISKGFFDKVDFLNSSDEMRSLVEEWLGQELIQKLTFQFSNFAFFGLSSLGSNPDLDNRIPRFRPFRVADPLLWLLSEEKIIASK